MKRGSAKRLVFTGLLVTGLCLVAWLKLRSTGGEDRSATAGRPDLVQTAASDGWLVDRNPRGSAPVRANPLPGPAVDADDLPRPLSSQVPPVSAYGEIETIRQAERTDPSNGVIERVRLVRADFKYPLLRVEESFVIDEHDADRKQVLLKRTVMVASHVLVSKPDPTLPNKAGFQILGEVSPGSDAWRVSIPSGQPEDLPEALATLKGLMEVAEPDYLVFHQQIVPNDAVFSDLWGMRNTGQTGGTPGADVKATQAWQHETGGGGVVVAVIDSGVDYLHPDLQANIRTNSAEVQDGIDNDGNGYIDDFRGWDFHGNDNDPMDDHFHGTHVAGTIGARGNNSVGVAGVIWDVKILPLKFLSANGGGTTSDAIAAVRYSADNGARISCNSWGGGGYSQLLEDAIRHAGDMDSLFVAAAGNSASDNDAWPSYPASYHLPNIISVAATDHDDEIAWFSNYGADTVHIAAPGVGISSTFPQTVTAAMAESGLPANYGRISGTSMATPHVAGAAALLLDSDPGQTAIQLRNRILQRADFLPGLSALVSTSARLNVANLVDPSWVAGPAALSLARLEWREAAGQSDGDGVAGPGERLEFIADISNRGGTDAQDVIFSAELVAGPAALVSTAGDIPATFEAYSGIQSKFLAAIAIDSGAQDLDEIVLRLRLTWQGGGTETRDVSLPVTKLSALQASRQVDFSIGEMIRGPLPNKTFLFSPSAWRVIEFDTEAGSISRYSDLDQGGLNTDAPDRRTGGLATNAEGSLLFAALTSTRRIQVFSLPDLVPLRTLEVDHEPYSLAVDAQGSLFTTSMDYWGPLREVDVNNGRTLTAKNISSTGRSVYQAALLETNSTRQRLFLAETDLVVTGGPGYVYEWDVSGTAMNVVAQHPNTTFYLNDFALDEQNSQLLTMHGGIYGVQVTSLSNGEYGDVWPLRSPYGVAVDVPPGKDFLFGGSGALYPGMIRRFQKGTGADLGAFAVQPASSGAFLRDRGMIATANDRVLYVSTKFTGSTTTGIGGALYYLNLTGLENIDVSLPPPVPFPPKPMLAKVEFSDLAGNGDNLPNPGETVHLAPFIRNIGGSPTVAGILEIESLDPRVTLTGASSWNAPSIPGRTTIPLPETGVLIGAAVPDNTAVDFRFRFTLGDTEVHEFLHRITVRVPQVPAVTSPFTMSALQYTGLAAHPSLNEVYLIDSRYLRVVVFDTTYGMIRRIEPIPVANRLVNGQLVKLGEPAVSPDGTLLAVAGNETNRVFVFSLPEVSFVASHTTTFRPTHVTFDSMNRLHVTGTNKPAGTTLKTLRMDPVTGDGQIQYGVDAAGSPLRASEDGSLIGRRESGFLKIYNGSGEVPVLVYNIQLPANELHDFEIDPVAGKAYLIVGDGKVLVRNLADGVQVAAWPLNNPNWGSAVRLCPNGDLVAASDYWYGGGVRRYSAAGATLHDVALTDYNDSFGGNAGAIIPRGLAVTPNNRVVFIAKAPNPMGTSIHADGQDYSVGMIGVPIILTEPGPDPLKLTSLALQDPAPANNNGYAEPGEKIVLVPTLQNTGFTLLNNVVLSLVSGNPAVVPVAPLTASFSAVNSGITFSTSSSGLAATVGSGVKDGESLGLQLQISHSAGVQRIPLDLFATNTLRANAELSFAPGMLLSDPSRNRVHLTDKTTNRIVSLDTEGGTVTAAGRFAGTVGDGGIALSADGSMIAAALTGSNQIQILATDTLASIDVMRLDFSPASVAFGSNGRIYATTSQTWSRPREIDPSNGRIVSFGIRDYYRNSRLKPSADHARMVVYEVESGNTLDEYLVDGETPGTKSRTYSYKGSSSGDLVLDEELRRIYQTVGGIHGIQLTNLDYGVTEGVWPLGSNHGKACAFLPGSGFVYGGSGSENGQIRRYERRGGRPQADYPLAFTGTGNYSFYLIDRGLAVTRNQRVLFATRSTPSPFLENRHFLSLIGRSTLNLAIPLARPKVDAGEDRTVKLSKPLTLQPVLEPSSGSGTPATAWSKLSGPGTVVFSTNSGTTVTNFSQPGKYRLQFSATVDGVTAADSVWVDVQPDDPWINLTAISGKAMRHPGLQGGFILSREGDPSIPLTVQLQRSGTAVSGTDFTALPASVVMAVGVSSVRIPLVLLPGSGVGTVDLTVLPATGYQPGVSSTATVTIVPAGPADWLAAAQETRPDLELCANGDANGNGLDNLLEYLLGRNPFEPSHDSPLAVTVQGNPRSVTASFRAFKNPGGAELAIEFSTNLANWGTDWNGSPAVNVLQRTDHGDGTETVTAALSPAAAAQPSGYLRLKAGASVD